MYRLFFGCELYGKGVAAILYKTMHYYFGPAKNIFQYIFICLTIYGSLRQFLMDWHFFFAVQNLNKKKNAVYFHYAFFIL